MPEQTKDLGRIHEDHLLDRLRALHVVIGVAQDTLASETPGFDELGGYCLLMRLPGDRERVMPIETRQLLRATGVPMAHQVATAVGAMYSAGVAATESRLDAVLFNAANAYPALLAITSGRMDDDEDPDLQALLFRVSQAVQWAYGELLELVAPAKGVDRAAS